MKTQSPAIKYQYEINQLEQRQLTRSLWNAPLSASDDDGLTTRLAK